MRLAAKHCALLPVHRVLLHTMLLLTVAIVDLEQAAARSEAQEFAHRALEVLFS
jgi:hypothetical protein